MIGTDSHTPNASGLGMLAIGVGGADGADVMAGLPWEVMYPRRIGVRLTGKLNGWTAPKDVILYLAGVLTVAGGTNSIIEYFGPGARAISCTGKATIANMGAELGATGSIFPFDDHMAVYLNATDRAELVAQARQHPHLLEADPEVEADPDSYYDRVVDIDLSTLEPHVVGPHTPDLARPISQLADEVKQKGYVDHISTALIGSCTNSSYEDMSRAADVAHQAQAHGAQAATRLLVTPGSEQIRATIERDGQMKALQEIRGTVLANACGPCIGQWRRAEVAQREENTIVSSYNRNFPRRNDGNPGTMNFIASPEIVVAMSLAGSLSFNPLEDTLTAADGSTYTLAPPKTAPEVPGNGFDPGVETYVAPPDDGSDVEIVIDPGQQPTPGPPTLRPLGRQRLPRYAYPAEGQGQVHHRPHLPRRPLAPLPRPLGQPQRQYVPRRHQRLHRRGGPRTQPRHRRNRPGISPDSPPIQGGRAALGGRRRPQLRRGQQP